MNMVFEDKHFYRFLDAFAFAKGDVNTPYGYIRCSWIIEDGGFKLTAEIPAGTQCEIVLPSGRSFTEGSGSYCYEEKIG